MRRTVTWVGIIALACLTGPLAAATIAVPGDYPTIQAAVDAAVDGDTILIADGVYPENLDFLGKAVTVASHFLLNRNPQHIDATIIDGGSPPAGGPGSTVCFQSGEDTASVLAGLTVTGGSGTLIRETPTPVRAGGGVLFTNGSGGKLDHCRITANTIISTGTGLGAGVASGPAGHQATIVVDNCTVSGNRVTATEWAEGGGMSLTGNVIIRDSRISDNTVASEFNSAVGGGIRILCDVNTTPLTWARITGTDITRNTAVSTMADAFGGGLNCSGSGLELTTSTITNNFLSGGTRCYGAGIFVGGFAMPNTRLIANLVSRNGVTSGQGFGGGICLWNTCGHIAANVVSCNSATNGAGLMTLNSQAEVVNSALVGNIAAGRGGGIYLDGGWIHLINGNLCSNTALSYGGGIFATGGATLRILNAIIWTNLAANGYQIYDSNSATGVAYSNVEGGWPGTGNIDLPPQLDADGCHLPEGSPCIDCGVMSSVVLGLALECPDDDIDGERRPWFGAPDMGADEYHGAGAVADDRPAIPAGPRLDPAYPNPFNGMTVVPFALPSRERVRVVIVDLLGRPVATLVDGVLPAGEHRAVWHADRVATGVYFCRMMAGNGSATRRITVTR